MSEREIYSVVSKLNNLYGVINPLKIHRGDIHEYLSIALEFSKRGAVKIVMQIYVDDLLEKEPEDFEVEAATPAGIHLFNANVNF